MASVRPEPSTTVARSVTDVRLIMWCSKWSAFDRMYLNVYVPQSRTGLGVRAIAAELGRSPATTSRELRGDRDFDAVHLKRDRHVDHCGVGPRSGLLGAATALDGALRRRHARTQAPRCATSSSVSVWFATCTHRGLFSDDSSDAPLRFSFIFIAHDKLLAIRVCDLNEGAPRLGFRFGHRHTLFVKTGV